MIKISEQDKEFIKNLQKEIQQKMNAMSVDTLIAMKNPVIGIENIGEVEDKSQNKTKVIVNEYAFFMKAYYMFAFMSLADDDYAAYYLAKQVYSHDEDELYVVSIDTDVTLGYYQDKKGIKRPSSVCEFTFKALQYDKRDKTSGLPFKIVDVKIVDPDK